MRVMSIATSARSAAMYIVLGFAFAGLLASAFELFTERRASFGLLQAGGVVAVGGIIGRW